MRAAALPPGPQRPGARSNSARGHGSRPRWYARPAVMVTLALVALLLTGLAGGAWYISSGFDALHRLSTPPPQISGDRLGGNEEVTIDTNAAQRHVEQAAKDNPGLSNSPDGSVTFLLMGVDARPGEPIDVDVRPDSIAVVHLDGETQACRMLSIPRDTRVELPGYGQSKVNHALAVGGVPYEQLVVEHLLGIEIDYYGLIDFAGLTQLVDAIGGITVINDEEFYEHPYTYPAGTLQLDGEEALNFARYRGGPDGDFGRQERQQQVVRAILTKGAGLDVMTAVPELLSAVDGHIRTDLGAKEMVQIGQRFRSGCTAETLETARLDGTVGNAWDDLLQLELSFVTVDEEEVRRKIGWLQGQG
jgi:LCP family protein required for cell wall assembly